MIKRFWPKYNRLILAGSIVFIAVLGGAALWWHKHRSATSTGTATTITPSGQSSKGSVGSTSKGASNSPTTSTASPSKQTSPTTTAANSGLTAPQGQANHTIVSKSAGDQAENSPNLEVTCLTSSSNNCIVRLTSPKGQVTLINNTYNDKQGNFVFDWSAKSYQTGTWKMEIVASKDGQEAATNIGPLEITP